MHAFPLGKGTLILPALALTYLIAMAALPPSPPSVLGDAHQASLPSDNYSRRPTAQGYGIFPPRGPAGTRISVSAGGFRDFTTVESITMGGVEILGNRTVATDDDGNLQIDGLVVPGLDPGVATLTIRVGSGDLETTAVSTFEITGPAESAGAEMPVREALEPLGDSLERVFHFENTTKQWSFFDPLPAFRDANSLAVIREGQVYWIKVARSLTIDLNGQSRNLTCANEGNAPADCWNVVVW
jgi:hypothetical protein